MNKSIDIKLTMIAVCNFIKKLNDTGDCIEWTGALNKSGYGQLTCNGISYRAHRVAYFLHHGKISNDLVIDHMCKNRKCCNPEHLREVSQKTNASENTDSVKTHCKNGHEFNDINTYFHKDGPRVRRKCKQCCANRRLIYNEKRKNE